MDSQQMMELLLKEMRAWREKMATETEAIRAEMAAVRDKRIKANMNAWKEKDDGLPRDGGASRRGKADLSGQEA
jgi:hypothetical protein